MKGRKTYLKDILLRTSNDILKFGARTSDRYVVGST